jgi:tRNA A22 N-methylase
VAGERSADDIQRDIERSRAALAEAVDQIAERGNPKRIVNNGKQSLLAKAKSTEGKVVIAAVGGLVVVLIVRRARKH